MRGNCRDWAGYCISRCLSKKAAPDGDYAWTAEA
jgi:hypothetical protein